MIGGDRYDGHKGDQAHKAHPEVVEVVDYETGAPAGTAQFCRGCGKVMSYWIHAPYDWREMIAWAFSTDDVSRIEAAARASIGEA